jgi:hypothetical protein
LCGGVVAEGPPLHPCGSSESLKDAYGEFGHFWPISPIR